MANQINHFNILIIEDDDDHAEIMEFYIKESNKDVSVNRLDDGEKAMQYILNIIKNEPNLSSLPNLIFLDLKLPKFDGHEILEKIKKNPFLKQTPVIVFTSSNSNLDVERALENNANSYIVKPIEQNKFKEIINLIITYWQSNERMTLNRDYKDGNK